MTKSGKLDSSLRTGRKTGKKLPNGLDPTKIGKATQFQPGESGNPGGRPKALISDATRDWLKEIDPATGKTNAVLVAEAQGKKALDGETYAYNALADRTEGKPAQTQQHEVISHDPIKVEIDAPDLLKTLRAIYGLSGDSGKST